MSGISQAEFEHLTEENEELHKLISKLDDEKIELQKKLEDLEIEKEARDKESIEQKKKLEDTEQKLKETEDKLHQAEDHLNEYEEREQGEDDELAISKMQTSVEQVRVRLAAAHRRNSREGRRKTSIMMGQDVELDEMHAKNVDLEDQLKASREELEMLQGFKVMNDRLQQDRRDDQAEHGRVKEALEEQIKHCEAEIRTLREKNTDLQNEIAAAREELDRQTGNAILGADESSGTGDTTPVNNLHRSSFFCLSNDLKDHLNYEPSEVAESHAASEASTPSTEKSDLRERIEEAKQETDKAKQETDRLKEDHEVTKTEFRQVCERERSLQEEMRAKLEELKRLSVSHQQLQKKCDSQRMELGRLQSECAKHLARATSAERHPVQMNIVSPSITSPFFKLSAKISTLQQQLERAKHSENELRSQMLK